MDGDGGDGARRMGENGAYVRIVGEDPSKEYCNRSWPLFEKCIEVEGEQEASVAADVRRGLNARR